MKTTNGNDYAFARSAAEYENMDGIPMYNEPSDGLTKRELFAAMAMQGLMARPNWPFDGIAGEAIFVADALIDALNKDASEEPND